MKRVIISTILVLAGLLLQSFTISEHNTYSTPLSIFSDNQSSANDGAKMKIEKMEYDFGKIVFKSTPKSVVFKFTNTGNAPLVITRTELSCTCLSVEYPRQPVMPGKSGTITVTYSPKKDLGAFSNTVKVFSNSTEKRPAILFVRGDVIK